MKNTPKPYLKQGKFKCDQRQRHVRMWPLKIIEQFLSALYQMVTFFTAKVHNTKDSEIRFYELNFIFIQKTSMYYIKY